MICGHPFPNTEVIPLINDILESKDQSEVNQDELNQMPSKWAILLLIWHFVDGKMIIRFEL